MKSLPPICSRDAARRRLGGWMDRLRAWRRGAPAATLELVYLPEWAVLVCGIHRRQRRRGWLIGNGAAGSLVALGGEPPWQCIAPEVALDAISDPQSIARVVKRQLRLSRIGRGAWVMHQAAHPYWVYYVPHSGDRLDVRLLDAVTGRPVATGLKLAFLDALLRAAGPRRGVVSAPPSATPPH